MNINQARLIKVLIDLKLEILWYEHAVVGAHKTQSKYKKTPQFSAVSRPNISKMLEVIASSFCM